MPVNIAEKKFFNQLAAQQSVTPVKSLASLTVGEFRKNAELFSEFTGSPADIPFIDDFVRVRDDHKIRIRIYNPNAKKTPALIFYPGCGYVLDLFEINAIACSRIAQYSQIKVILVDFRLAPEYPLPTSIYDAYDVTCYIAKSAALFGIDQNHIFIGGL